MKTWVLKSIPGFHYETWVSNLKPKFYVKPGFVRETRVSIIKPGFGMKPGFQVETKISNYET